MPINDTLPVITPNAAALAVGVGIQSIRRWCEWHSIHLSASANPGPGLPRRLTPRDLEVLKTVRDLRYQGLQTDAINEKLAQLTFAEIDDNEQEVDTAIALPTAPDPSGQALAPLVAPDYVLAIERRFEALERSREPAFVVGLGLGFIAALLFVIVLIGLAVLYGGFR